MSPLSRRQLLGASSFFLAVDARRFFDGEETPLGDGAQPDGSGPQAGDAPGEEPHMRRAAREVDVLVVGGGMAGVCAALSAARNGARTLLIQDRSRLGGNASSEIRMHIVGADNHGSRAGWREGGLIEEIRLHDAVHNPHRAWELFDLTLYDLCQREESLEVLLDTTLYSVERSGDRIQAAWARCDKTETLYRIEAKNFVDSSGDARLALEAGAPFRTGREARAEFGEALALEQADPKSQGCSLLFTARKHDRPIPFVAPPWAREITEQDLLFRGIPRGSYEYGFWWIELGGTRDVIHDGEALRHELLRVVLGVWNWIKNSGQRPDSANWALETVGMIPGKRESRRVEGPLVQTQELLEGGWKQRGDGVAIGGWNFDDHPPGGFDDWNSPPYFSRPLPEPYNIALEALYSRGVANLFMAGRNISNSHVAFTSTRVMATCAATGQAVGTAAALCSELGVSPAELRKRHMPALQQRLLRDDQTIRAVANQDPLDLARKATVKASHHLPEAAPEHVLDGYVRDVPGQWTHRWGARLEEGEAWIELQWEQAVEIGRVQFTFDSGFHRELTLSASNHVTSRVVRGPQPETIRAYRVTAQDAQGKQHVLAEASDNYQRLVRHDFPSQAVTALRLTVISTHGAPEARLFEIRAYG